MEKTAAILIIGEFEDETRNLADALAAEYRISAAPNMQEAARRLEKETFGAIIYVFLSKGSDLTDMLQSLQNPLRPSRSWQSASHPTGHASSH